MKVWILGIGMGPAHVTAEVASALRSADYVVASEKSSNDSLLALRRTVVDTYAPSTPIVTVADPARDRSPGLTEPGYVRAVADWHAARVQRYADVLRARGGTAAFLVWGDPALYDSTIRIVDQVKALDSELGYELDYDVLPGISAPQLLAARHRIVLHEVGRPVHITTGRRLEEAVAAGHDNIVAMLNSQLDLSAVGEWTIWWGANLGAAGERLVTGRVSDVVDEIAAARDAARAEAGWVMDIFLVRKP